MSKRNIVKPTGLKGAEKLNRMKQLMGVTPINESVNRSVIELTKVGPDGNIYAIVRENQEYYIKSCKNKKNVISEDFKYIGGLQNKKSKSYPSYAKAIKHLNLKFISLNEAHSKSGNINTFENDNILDEHHAIATDKAFSETKPMDKNISKEYIVNKKGAKLSYDNKKGKEKDGFGDNVADKDAIDELEDVKLNETERLIDKFLVESILDGDLENKIFKYMSVIKGMKEFGMGQKRNWTETKKSDIFKGMRGDWDMDISDEDKLKYEELDFDALNKVTKRFLEIVNALDGVDETSYESFKQLQPVIREFLIDTANFYSQLMSIRLIHKEMWGNVGGENRHPYDSREGTYRGSWFIELSSQLVRELRAVVTEIEKNILYKTGNVKSKGEGHIRENATKETLTVGKLNNYITEMMDELDPISYAKQSGERKQIENLHNNEELVAAAIEEVGGKDIWDTLSSEEKEIVFFDVQHSGIDEPTLEDEEEIEADWTQSYQKDEFEGMGPLDESIVERLSGILKKKD